MVITNRATLAPVRVGLEIAAALSSMFGEKYNFLDDVAIVWNGGSVGTREARRRSRGGGRALERGRSPLAPLAREVLIADP